MINIKIDKISQKPYYLQIQEQIRSKIVNGELTPETRLLPIREWASLLGVNLHTLDRALNNLVKEGMLYRRRKLGTFVNGNKKTMKKKKSFQSNLLIFLPKKEKLSYPYTQEVIKGINSKSLFYNLEIKIKSIDRKGVLPIGELSKKNIAGIIIDKEGFLNKDAIKLIEKYKGKIAFFNSFLPTHREIPSVVMDNEKGTYLATEYLIKKGHERIAILLRSNVFSHLSLQYQTDSLKLESYRLALEKHNLEIRDEYQKGGVYSNPEKIKESVEELLSLNTVPTAILCADDLIAFETLKVLNGKNIKVPEDISLIGFNNFIHSQMSQPQLTTIETPMFEMGQKAVDLLFTNAESTQIVLNVTLIERDSVNGLQVKRIKNEVIVRSDSDLACPCRS